MLPQFRGCFKSGSWRRRSARSQNPAQRFLQTTRMAPELFHQSSPREIPPRENFGARRSAPLSSAGNGFGPIDRFPRRCAPSIQSAGNRRTPKRPHSRGSRPVRRQSRSANDPRPVLHPENLGFLLVESSRFSSLPEGDARKLRLPCSPATSAVKSTPSGMPSGPAAFPTRSKSSSRSPTCCSSIASTTCTRWRKTKPRG